MNRSAETRVAAGGALRPRLGFTYEIDPKHEIVGGVTSKLRPGSGFDSADGVIKSKVTLTGRERVTTLCFVWEVIGR